MEEWGNVEKAIIVAPCSFHLCSSSPSSFFSSSPFLLLFCIFSLPQRTSCTLTAFLAGRSACRMSLLRLLSLLRRLGRLSLLSLLGLLRLAHLLNPKSILSNLLLRTPDS